MKRCSKCKEERLISEFRRIRNEKGEWIRHSWCTPCKNAAMRESRKNSKAEDGRKIRRPGRIGAASHTAKLTDDDVRLVRQLEPRKYYEVADEVAEKFEVSRSTVLGIWRGETWTHV